MVGRNTQIFVDMYKAIYVQDNWLPSVQNYMQDCHKTIKCKKPWTTAFAQINNVFIIKLALGNAYNARELKVINNWLGYWINDKRNWPK